MILAYVCDVFPPYSSISAATLNYDWAKEACAQGHKVVVITPDPTITEPYTDTVDAEFGFRVIRVKTDSLKVKWAKSTGGKRFIDKFLRAWAEIKAPYHMIEAIKKNDDMPMFDGVVFYSPTVFFAPVIKFLKQRSSCPVYQILRDLYPDQLVEMKEIHRHSPSYFLMKWATGQQHNLSDCIAVESGAVKKKMVATGFGQYPLEILNNWMTPAPNTGCSLDLSQTKLAGKKVFVYAGTMGTAQRVESFIDLADRLRDHSDIGFLLIGPGDQKDFLQQKIQSLSLSNVMMHDGISATEIPGLFAQCSAGLLSINTVNIPGKLMGYALAGLPTLVIAPQTSDLPDLVQRNNLGVVVTTAVGQAVNIDNLTEAAQTITEKLETQPTWRDACKTAGRNLFATETAVRHIVSTLATLRPGHTS